MLHVKDSYAPGIQTVFVMKYYRPDGTVSPKTLGLYRDLSGGGSGGHKHLSHSG